MGWDFTHREPGTTDRAFFTKHVFNQGTTVHATRTVGNVFYAAIDNPNYRPGEVHAYVYLIERRPRGNYYNFGYKDVPHKEYASFPLDVLDALTPSDDPEENAWRDHVRVIASLDNGDKVHLTAPLTFNDDITRQDFTIRVTTKNGKQVKMLTDGGTILRVPGWQDQVVAVTRAGSTERIATPSPVTV